MTAIVDHLLEGVPLPRFVRIRQQFPTDHIPPEEIRHRVMEELHQPQIARAGCIHIVPLPDLS